MPKPVHIEQVFTAMERMDAAALERVRAFADRLLTEQAERFTLEQEQAERFPVVEKPATSKPVGHIELKMIGKWGPYAYRRTWDGNRLRSEYLGKVAPGEAGSSDGSDT